MSARLRRRGAARDQDLRPAQLVGDAVAEPGPDRRLDVGRGGAGQDPAVQLHRGSRRHHVPLGRALEQGRRHGGPGHRRDQRRPGSGAARARPAATSVDAQRGPARRLEPRRRRRVGHPAADPAQQLAQQRDGVVADVRASTRARPRRPRSRATGQRALLADADGRHRPAVGQREQLATTLVDRRRPAGCRGAASSSQRMPTSAMPSSSSATARNHRSPRGRKPDPGQLGHRDRPRRDLVLHVDRAAAVQVAVVVDDALERRVRPVPRVAPARRRCARRTPATARRRCPGSRATRLARCSSRATSSHVDAGALQVVAQVRRRGGLVAGRRPSSRAGALLVSIRIRSRATRSDLVVQAAHAADSQPVEDPGGDLGLVGQVPEPARTGRRGRPPRARSGTGSAATTPGRCARSAATHFAGSCTITRGSCTAPVTSRSGRAPAAGRLSYGE